ncbi:hypothetical protein K525DRAFT_211588 [Schizophyllum commune Loenen D]|nr:hypothetical protein K525DRAFT_211588 [Schizophyllum commune Loenen D]
MEGVETTQPGGRIPQTAEVDYRPGLSAVTVGNTEAKAPASEQEDPSDDDEEPPVSNPSTNICGDLEKALGRNLTETFKGSFSFSKTYSDAPNPGLNLLANNIGRIGLPLNEREAKVIISGCKQAPFGKGERTVVDAQVRDTWEMDASEVQFINPEWQTYMQKMLTEVCAALGVNMAVSQPRTELYKLLLYETGSHFLPHVDTEKVDTMFATIIVVLPSPFTGGAAHLSHGSLSEVYDCAPASDMKTTVLSWYTDVTHSIKPITSGYRLALAYNVYHTTNTLRPSLPDTHSAVEALRHVLLSWKQTTNPDAPRKIIYLLDHKYSQANMKGSALKGLDAHKLAILQLLAKQHDFRLGLASLETSLSGYADDNGCSYGRSRYGRYGYYDDSEEEDDEDVDFAEVEETETKITNLVDLEGRMLQDELEFDAEGDECIPGDLTEAVQQGDHDGQDYEGYMGNGAGSLSRWYRRTVLVIWPKKFSLGLTFEDDIEDAIDTLVNVSEKPHKRERKLVNFLLGFAKARGGDNSDIAQNLTHVAFMWSDRGLWVQAMEACGITGVETLSIDDIINVLGEFGMETVQPVLEKMMIAEKLNAHRFQFLDDLETACSRLEGPAEGQLVNWLAVQRKWALEHLQPPRVEDKQELLDIAYKHGGLPLLRDTFVPQLEVMPIPDFLASLATLLHTQKITPDTPEEEKTVLKQIVTDLLVAAISKVDFFAMTTSTVPIPPPPGYPLYGMQALAALKTAVPQTAVTYIDYCLATGNEALVEIIINRLLDRTGLSPVESQSRAKTVLLPLLPLVGAKVKARPADAPAVPGVQRLFDTAIQIYLSALPHAGPSKEDITALVQACILEGGTRLLINTIWPALRAAPYQEATMLAFIQEVHAKRAEIPVSDGALSVDTVIAAALKLVISKATGAALGNRTKTIELLKLCFAYRQTTLCSNVFSRLLDKSYLKSDYVEHVLVPFIPELRQFLISNGTATHAEPFGAVFTTIVSLWARLVLGPKPADTSGGLIARMARHSCRCDACTSAFNFLTAGEGRTHTLSRIGAVKRRHVEKELSMYAFGAATWQMIGRSPQGLSVSPLASSKHQSRVAKAAQITKADAIYQPVQWRAKHAKGTAILQSVSSNQDELRRIFGASYQMVMDELQGVAPVKASRAPLAPAAPGPAAGPSNAATAPTITTTSTAPAPQPPTYGAPAPSRKRKATYDPNDVIDISEM